MIQGLKHKTYTEFYNLHEKFNKNEQYGGIGQEGLKKMFTYDNHLSNVEMLRNLAKQFDQLSAEDQDVYIKELEKNELENRQIIHVLKHAWIFKERPKLKDLMQMIPNQVMNKHKQHPYVKHSEKPIFHSDYYLPKEFEDFMEKIEANYLTQENMDLVHKMNREEVFSESQINKKINAMAGQKSPDEHKDHDKFIYHDEFKTRKLQFLKDEHRDQFNQMISKYFSDIAQQQNHKQDMKNKQIDYYDFHQQKTEEQRKIQEHDITETDAETQKFINNSLNNLKDSIDNQEYYDPSHIKLIDHINKHLIIHQEENSKQNQSSSQVSGELINSNFYQDLSDDQSFIQLKSKLRTKKHSIKLINMFKQKSKRDESQFNDNPQDQEEGCDNKELDAMGQELTKKIAAYEKLKAEKLAKSLKKVKPGPSANKDLFKLTKLKNDLKMIILIVIALITAFFRVCVPPIILAFKSCAEAAVLPMNLMHLFNFDEKTSQIQKQCLAWPTFFLNLPLEPEIQSDEMVYYSCAQAYLCMTCSTIWPMCNIIPFIVTNAPIVTIPFLFFLPLLDWLALLPGDNPPCFYICLYVMDKCEGIKFNQITPCTGIFNLDNLLLAMMDPGLLIFMGFTFVPGLCNFTPFLINEWMIPRFPKTEEQQLREAVPEIEEFENAQKQADNSKSKCGGGLNTPFADGLSQQEINNAEDSLPEENNRKRCWEPKYIIKDWHIHNWEHYQTTPENSQKDTYVRDLISSSQDKALTTKEYSNIRKEVVKQAKQQHDFEHIVKKVTGTQKKKKQEAIQQRIDAISSIPESRPLQPLQINVAGQEGKDMQISTTSGGKLQLNKNFVNGKWN